MSELEKTNEADGDNSQHEQMTEDSTEKSKEGEAEAFDQEKANRLREEVENAFKSRDGHYSLVKRFALKDKTSRADLIGIPGLVTKYNALNDMDNTVYESYNDWLDACGKSIEELETDDHALKPSTVEALFDEFANVQEKAKEKFLELMNQFPNHVNVINHLKQFKDPSSLETFDAKSGSSCGASTKAEEYVKRKVKDLKEEMTTKFMKVDAENNLGAGKTVPVPELIRQLDVVDKKLETFDNLLEKLYNIEEAEADFEVYEAWKREFSVKVTDLRGKLENFNVPQATTKDKNSFMSVIKKRDPPKFDGDHLQYLEWKIKWKALISVHKPDPIYELDLLKENIPEQGRKNLFGCESLVKAFDLLDKLCGDQKLITQKLKSRLRNLKPVSTEPHEIVIEMQEEIDCLVKRLKALNALN